MLTRCVHRVTKPVGERGKDASPFRRMRFQDVPFLFGRPTVFVEDCRRYRQLTHVMQQRTPAKFFSEFFVEAHFVGQHF
jgi:hypothetical protein